ncbi:disease resistance protein At4g27190-like [Solanum stenotomum]|uniref:disease resistance protein At4g27190-like n=1 Tax=Solanum stenotomum TaxID=172797 RepID=UPI0020D15E1B|nr:disease resistance protein At4g27190-like [Solanum stenotomum]
MEILFNAVGGFFVEVGKNVCKCICPDVENTIRFSSKLKNLRNEMEKLTKFRDDIKKSVEGYEKKGYKPKLDVIQWIEDVHKLESEWETMQESIAAAKRLTYKCCPKCILGLEVSTQARIVQDQLFRLIEVRKSFGSNLVVENYQMKKVEFMPGPLIEGQSAATKNLHKILQLLEDDKVCIIGVWGTRGVGKTTLVNNLNNELLKNDVSSFKLSFGVVLWVTVPKLPIDIRKVQTQIASRLNLKIDSEGNVKSIASKIYRRLEQEKSFLLILDDVWEPINLDDVGVPQLEDPARSKVIITSRSLDVCKQMKIDTEMKVYTLDEDESWKLFIKNAGDNANLEHIQPLAKEIARECDGLPLAVIVIGASMRGKTRVELWEDALKSLRMSEPHNKDVKDKVYKVIKWSFDSLESQDIELSSEQRSNHVKKKRGDHIQSCFLYCSLYPVSISTDELISCWWAEEFLGEHDTYEEVYNRGITMIESLKDACLLETHNLDSVKMHDVVRDVAIWIAKSFGVEHNSVFQDGIGISSSVKRISFVSNKIQRLPDNVTECPETTTLLLQDNNRLLEIPHEFFLAFPALRVLNLSETGITSLPSSINSLYQLHALILKNCHWLTELPPINNLRNLLLLDCDNTRLHHLPQGMDKLTNLRLLYLPATDLEGIGREFFLNLSSIEMLNMMESKMMHPSTKFGVTLLGATSFDEISSLHNLTSLFIRLDSSSIFNRDHTWMSRLKRFRIEVGETPFHVPFNKSARTICISGSDIFRYGKLSGMLQFASHLYLQSCLGLRKLFVYNSFDGLKSLYIRSCSCSFNPPEEGSGTFDPLPNLEYLNLEFVYRLKSFSDFSQLLGLRFSKLRQLDMSNCSSLTCLFSVGDAFSIPKNLEEITITSCKQLVELFVERDSSQTTLVKSETPRVRKLVLRNLPKLGNLGEPQSMWEHLEVLTLIRCNEIRKLPLSIQTSKSIKLIRGTSEWWSQLEWDGDKFKSNLKHCFRPLAI